MNELPILRDERKLFISRIPKETKELFIEIANKEFEGDYGMLLKELVEDYCEFKQMKFLFFENIDNKLNTILSKIDNHNQPENSITLLSGKKIIKEGIKNG